MIVNEIEIRILHWSKRFQFQRRKPLVWMVLKAFSIYILFGLLSCFMSYFILLNYRLQYAED